MNIAVVAVCVFILSNMPSPLFAMWELEMGFDARTTTLLFSAYQGGVVVGLLGLSRYIDRTGWRRTLTSATAVGALAALLFALASGPVILAIARFITGISIAVLLSCGAVAIARLRKAEGHLDGPMVAGFSFSAGLALGPVLGGSAGTIFPAQYRAVFAAEAVALLIASFVVMRSGPLARLDCAASIAGMTESNDHGPQQPCQPAIRTATLVLVSTGITCAIFMGLGSTYLKQQLGDVDSMVAGALIAIIFGGAASAQLLAKILGTLGLAVSGPLMGLLSLALLAYGVLSVDVPALFAAAATSGASQGLGQVAALTIVRDHASAAEQRAVLGRLNAWGYSISGSAVILIGMLVAPLGLSAAIVSVAAAVGTASTAVLILTWLARRTIR
jgi:MFS family permease